MTDEEFVRAHWEWPFVYIGKIKSSILLKGHVIEMKTKKGLEALWSAAAEFTRERLEEIRQLEAEIDFFTEGWGGWNNVLNEARGRIWVDDIVSEIRCMRILSRLEALLTSARMGMKVEVQHGK